MNVLYLTYLFEFDNRVTITPKRILYTKVEKFMMARAPRLDPEARRGMSGAKAIRDFSAVVYIQFISLLDTLKPFLIIIINKIILSEATVRVVSY
jgi:hypothetical protein